MDKIKDKLIKYSKVKIVQTLTKILKTGMYQRMARPKWIDLSLLDRVSGREPLTRILCAGRNLAERRLKRRKSSWTRR